MQSKPEYNSETLEALAKRVGSMAFLGDEHGSRFLDSWMVNEPFEVAELLRRLNHMINTLYMLSDTDYYLDYIFNASTGIREEVEKLGMTEDWLMETADKFEKLRSILYGDCLDWEEVSVNLMRNAAYATREDNNRLEDRNKKLEFDLREAKKK